MFCHRAPPEAASLCTSPQAFSRKILTCSKWCLNTEGTWKLAPLQAWPCALPEAVVTLSHGRHSPMQLPHTGLLPSIADASDLEPETMYPFPVRVEKMNPQPSLTANPALVWLGSSRRNYCRTTICLSFEQQILKTHRCNRDTIHMHRKHKVNQWNFY